MELQKVQLSDLGKIVTGKTPPTSEPKYFGEKYPFITPTDMHDRKNAHSTERYLSESGADLLKKKLLPADSVAVSCIGWQMGKAIKITKPSFTNQQLNSIIPNERVNADYLYYLLQTKREELFSIGSAAGVRTPILNKTLFSEYKVSIPPLEKQHEIATILSAFDDLIENNTRRIEILDEMARRIYREWFVHFRYPSHHEDELVDSGTELGEIPEVWEAIKLGDVLTKLESGNRPKGGVSQYDDGIPSVGAENVLGVGQYKYSKEKYVPEEFYEEMNKGIVEDYDVLIYKDGAGLGRVSIFGDGFPHRELCINSHAYLVRTDNTCSQAYLYFWMDSPLIKSSIRNSNTNAAQPGINMGDVRGFPFLIPSDKILEKFDEIGVPIVSQIFHLAKKNQRLKETRDLLLPKLISGKIDVGNISKQITTG